MNDEYLSLSTTQANSSQCDLEQTASQKNQFDLFHMMVTNQLVTMGVNSDPEYVTYENERERSVAMKIQSNGGVAIKINIQRYSNRYK